MPTSDCHQSKPKLLVILGAGSSVACEMPSVNDIDEQMKLWSREYQKALPDQHKIDLFKELWETVTCYYRNNNYRIRPNYEMVLGEMTALAGWVSPSPFGNPLIEAEKDSSVAAPLTLLQDPSDPYRARKEIVNQQTFLLERLARHMRDKSKSLNLQSDAFSDYRNFLRRLQDRFDLGVYNLNYDTVARAAWPEAFNGFNSLGHFDPLRVSQRREWGFVYHLHGSVHHCIDHRAAAPRIIWKEELDGSFADSGVLPVDMAQQFKPIPLTTLIAGGFKLDQILADPYQSFYSSLIRHTQEAGSILIAGYGFGDLHVNRAIQNRFERTYDDRSSPQVVVLEKSPPERFRTGRLEINEFWSYELRHTLKTTFSDGRGYPSENSSTVEDFIAKKEFEQDRKKRVAIWHGGFREAASEVDKIIEWLSKGV